MRILLTGSQGQVGFELRRALMPLGDVVSIDRAECDLVDGEAIRELVRKVSPAVVVNAAAYTAVDKAESDRAAAYAINSAAPAILGEEAARVGAFLIHYSTDYVFNGAKQGAYFEDDVTDPQSVYGESKLNGEQGLRVAHHRHLILRTSWVVGAHGENFAKTMLRLAGARDSLSVVSDQWGAPTSAALLADVTAHLIRQQQGGAESFPYGTYHCVAGGETNWHEYAKYIVTAALRAGRTMRTSPEAICPITTADYPTPARRPSNSRLDTNKFRTNFGLELPHWQHGLNHILQQILSSP